MYRRHTIYKSTLICLNTHSFQLLRTLMLLGFICLPTACGHYSIPDSEDILATTPVIHPLIDSDDVFTEFTNAAANSNKHDLSGAWTLSWESDLGIKTETWYLEDLSESLNITNCHGKTVPVDIQYQQVQWEKSKIIEPTEDFDHSSSIVEQKFFLNFIDNEHLDGSESQINDQLHNTFTIRGQKVSNRLSPIDNGLLEINTTTYDSRHTHICGSIKTKLSESQSTTIIKIETLSLNQTTRHQEQLVDPQLIIILSNPDYLKPGQYNIQHLQDEDKSFTFMLDATNTQHLIKITHGIFHIEKSTKYQFHASLIDGKTEQGVPINITIHVNFLNYEEQANPIFSKQNHP